MIAERNERVSEIEVDVDGRLGRLSGVGQTTKSKSHERQLQMRDGFSVGASRRGPKPRLAEIGGSILPHLPA